MFDTVIGPGLGIGLMVFYLVHTLVKADGWATVNWFIRLAPGPVDTTDDVIACVHMEHPRIAHWMGCQYCMLPWWAGLLTLLVNPSWITWFTAIGVAAVLVRILEQRR